MLRKTSISPNTFRPRQAPDSLCRQTRKLLSWFRRRRRDLPWRRTRDPYAIWVSEVMLQQTQVATVVPFFERFLARFPTIESLARAREQDVLRFWEGLGYYRRARNLHHAAKIVLRDHGGRFPRDAESARRLPGLGKYSVGAVLSQAYDLRLPIVEANSRRVLCRFFGFRGDPRQGPGQRWLWDIAERVLPARRAGDFNQALMELGALVCLPNAPRCSSCPLEQSCRARRFGLQEGIPPKAKLPTLIDIDEMAFIVQRGCRFLVVQRPPSATRWPGLWEFPHCVAPEVISAKAAARLLYELTGLHAGVTGAGAVIYHALTRHRFRMTCFMAKFVSGTFQSDFYRAGRWVQPRQLRQLPLSAPQRRLAQSVLGLPSSDGPTGSRRFSVKTVEHWPHRPR